MHSGLEFHSLHPIWSVTQALTLLLPRLCSAQDSRAALSDAWGTMHARIKSRVAMFKAYTVNLWITFLSGPHIVIIEEHYTILS